MLLDNDLPDNASVSLLTDIKGQPEMAGIIVVMLMPSVDKVKPQNDKNRADGFISKPIKSQELVDLLAEL